MPAGKTENVFDRIKSELSLGRLDDPNRTPAFPMVQAISPGQDVNARIAQLTSVVNRLQGTAASPLDQALTARDLVQAGIISIRQGNRVLGSGTPALIIGDDGTEVPTLPDLAVPPTPTDLHAAGTFRSVILDWYFEPYNNHAYTEIWRSSTNNLATATRIGTTPAMVYVDTAGTALGVTFYYWVRCVNTAGTPGAYNAVSGTSGGAGLIGNVDLGSLIVEADNLASGAVTASKIAAQAVTLTAFAAGITPVEIVSSLPGTGNFQGRTVLLTTDNKLYRYTGSAWTAAVPSTDITGQLTDAQIAAVAAAKITGQIVAAQIADAAVTAQKLSIAIGGGNLTENSSFEIDVGGDGVPDGWSAYASISAITRSSTQAKYGTYSIRATCNGGGVPRVVNGTNKPFIPNGQKVCATAWIYSTVAATAYVAVKMFNAATGGAELGTYITDSSTALTANTWTRVGGTVPIGVDGYGGITIGLNSTPANGTFFYADGAQLEFGDVPTAYAPKPSEILPGAITSVEIADNSITAPKIVAGAVVAGKIAANAVGANEIAANVITANKLVLTNTANMADNPSFELGSIGWTLSATGTSIVNDPANAFVGDWLLQRVSTANDQSTIATNTQKFTAVPGERYYLRGYVKSTSDATGTAEWRILWRDKAGTSVGVTVLSWTPNTSWTMKEVIGTAPANALTGELAAVSRLQTAGTWYWDHPTLTRGVTGELIVDGAITAIKIAANTITAAEIAAGTITSSELAANSVTATQIAAGSVTTAKVAAGAITANELAANSVIAGKIAAAAVNSAQIVAGAISTDKLLVTGSGAELNADPNATDSTAYLTVSGTAPQFITGVTDIPIGGTTALQSVTGTLSYVFTGKLIPIDQAKNYRAQVAVKRQAGSGEDTRCAVAWYDSSGVLLQSNVAQPGGAGNPAGWVNGTYSYFGLTGGTAPTTWTVYTIGFGPGETAKIPSNAKYMRLGVLMNVGTTAGVQIRATGYRVSEKAAADLIVDGAIIAGKIAAGAIAVGSAAIANGAIRNALIENLAVDNAKIADLAVDTLKLADLSVTTAKIVDANITNAKIANLAVTAAKIANATITTAQIANATITGANIANATITDANIGSLNADKITAGAIRGINVNASSHTTKGSYLTSAPAGGATTLNVKDTTDFASSGSGWIIDTTNDRDAFSWTGKTATTLTGCSGVLAHNSGATVLPAGKAIIIDSGVNEMRFFGDRGDGTIEEVTSVGSTQSGSDAVVELGTVDTTRRILNIRSKAGVSGGTAVNISVAGATPDTNGLTVSATNGYCVSMALSAVSTTGHMRMDPLAYLPSTKAVGALCMAYTTGGAAGSRNATPRLLYADGTDWRRVSDDTVFAG